MDMITTGGLRMPKLGLGTWRLSGADGTDAVLRALAMGYRHIDTAEMYGNEAEVGAALAQTDVPREEIHVTTKVWPDHLEAGAMRRAAETSLEKLGLESVDLYLVHWPAPGMQMPRVMENLMRLQQDGLVKHIGVSNFTVALMRACVEEARAPIVCNQVEYHVTLGQAKVLDFARAHGIAVTAYCPLGRGNLGDDRVLSRIAKKHGASAAQVALIWLLDQDGVAAIPKASRAENQRANWEAQTLALDDEDRAAIAAMPKGNRLVNPGTAPAWDAAA